MIVKQTIYHLYSVKQVTNLKNSLKVFTISSYNEYKKTPKLFQLKKILTTGNKAIILDKVKASHFNFDKTLYKLAYRVVHATKNYVVIAIIKEY